jgi:hypothetical protein
MIVIGTVTVSLRGDDEQSRFFNAEDAPTSHHHLARGLKKNGASNNKVLTSL